jgi:hypothetical protein
MPSRAAGLAATQVREDPVGLLRKRAVGNVVEGSDLATPRIDDVEARFHGREREPVGLDNTIRRTIHQEGRLPGECGIRQGEPRSAQTENGGRRRHPPLSEIGAKLSYRKANRSTVADQLLDGWDDLCQSMPVIRIARHPDESYFSSYRQVATSLASLRPQQIPARPCLYPAQ